MKESWSPLKWYFVCVCIHTYMHAHILHKYASVFHFEKKKLLLESIFSKVLNGGITTGSIYTAYIQKYLIQFLDI